MSAASQISVIINSVDMIMNCVSELKLASEDLRELEAEKRSMRNCYGKMVSIDYLVKNELGEKIGIHQTETGTVEFVVEKDTETVKETINKVSQAYSRLKILNEVKKKGYSAVKEEKLPNGSIRLVVEKWR